MATSADVETGCDEMLANLKIDEKNLAEVHLSSSTPAESTTIKARPTVVLMIGMAGAGKTTLTKRIAATLINEGRPPYIINLDPACLDPPYPVNIDIRDAIDYKKVMEQYHLGPNGAIVTCLNLFSTKFYQVIDVLLRKSFKSSDLILIDTPGQIEVFMWSASGQIILQSLAAVFPTTILYVSDLTTNINPITFISNMSYACSILYKSKLPLVITLNKCDRNVKPGMVEGVDEKDQDHSEIPATSYAEEWISDFEAYETALRSYDSYSTNLASSLALALDEFYSKIEYTSVSAKTGHGMDRIFIAIAKAVSEYETMFLPLFLKEKEAQKKKDAKASGSSKHQQELKELGKNMTVPAKKSKYDEHGESSAGLFSVPATSAAVQGFSLTSGGLGDDDEDTSSDTEDEDASDKTTDDEEADKESFREFFNKEIGKREAKAKHPGSK